MCVVKGVVKREPKTKQEVFWTDFVAYQVDTGSYLSSAAIGPWQVVLRLRGSLINRPISELSDRLEDYLEAAYNLGEVAGFTEALRLLYELGLGKDYLERPRTSEKLQKLAFELYWLTLRLEKTKIRRNERLAQKAAKLNYGFYRLFEKALKAACAHR
jgi:hypothetical protein